MGLTLIFTQSPTSQAQNKLPITSQKSIFNPPQKTEPFPTVSTGILKGWVVDEKKEPLINAAVGVYQDGELKGGNITDYYGNYSISPLKPGDYEVLVIALGFYSLKQSDVVIGDTIATSDFILNKPNGIIIETMGIIYVKPVLDFDNPGRHIFSATDISRIPH
jgi:hypothetical protein